MTPPLTKSLYQVNLPQFEGPLDLLLHLVDQEKLTLTEVSLAAVAQQYRYYLETLEKLNVEIESSYIVVFSQLLELKSKLLLPPERSAAELYQDDYGPSCLDDHGHNDLEDGPELLEQLQAYRLVKEAADWLGQRESHSRSQYTRPVDLPEPDLPELDVSLQALTAAWLRLDRRYTPPHQAVQLKRVVLSVPERMQQLWELLRRQPKTMFREILGGNLNRAYVIVSFLAILELVRRSRVQVQQAGLEDDIEVSPLQRVPQEEYR